MVLPLLVLLLIGGTSCQEQDSNFDMDYLDGGVDTNSGRILGRDTSFYGQRAKAYLGVPYAAPPTGQLRFKKPVAAEPWNGTLVTAEYTPACPQYSQVMYPWYDGQEGKSEDCLYMNIWSPRFSIQKYKLPVIFWIYGGGFTVGSNRIDSQKGLGLAVLGPNIVVAPNYRLNALGFFSSGTEHAPGNAGLYDLLSALQWVKDNIAAFGGDPDQITLMGQGSGSQVVSLLLMSPIAKGLYDKAILESGTFVSVKGNPNAYNAKLGQKMAEAVGCASENRTLKDEPEAVVDCLRDVDGQSLARVLSSFNPISTASFVPQYGDEILPNNPTEDLKQKNYDPVPILLGNNKDEGSFLLTSSDPELFGGVFGRSSPQISKDMGAVLIRKMFSHYPDPESVVEQYLGDVDDGDYDEIRKQVYTAAGDFFITCPMVYFAEQYSGNNKNNTVEYYVFAQRPKQSPWEQWMGVAHHDEVPFVFGRPLEGYDYNSFMENYNGELGLSYTLIRIWSNFVKQGKGLDMWKNFSPNHHQYMLLEYNVKKKMRGPGPHLDNCNFFRQYYEF